jgi:hypothetical protein
MAVDAAQSFVRTGLLALLFIAFPAPGGAAIGAAIPVAQAHRDADLEKSPLLAAAEPFEALTEQAFKASPQILDRRIAAAQEAADPVREALPPPAASELDGRLTDIHSALAANDRAGIALAAAEAYRILVSAAPQTKVPTAVNLLDYAAFRYEADLRSRPVRWWDMKSASEFAAEQWQAIAPLVSDPALAKQVETTLRQMDDAVARKSVTLASTAAKRALDLVDKLETHFSQM